MEERGTKAFPEHKTFFAAFKSPIGIEVEVEGFDVEQWKPGSIYWRLDKDGSLKDMGAELISVPVASKNIDYALAELMGRLSQQGGLRWSHRCSIHVHVNVRNWTETQLRTMMGAYAPLENLFFSLCKPERKASAFCYPLIDVDPREAKVGDGDGKYCALNTSEGLRKYGTCEFRHMHGTGDLKTLRRWIQLIVKLHAYCRKNDSEKIVQDVCNLNTVSNYHEFVQKIFGQTAVLFQGMDLHRAMRDGVMWAKWFFYHNAMIAGRKEVQ